MMKTIEELLTSDWYQTIITELIQLKPHIKFTQHADYEADLLMRSFKERNYVLEGLDSSIPTEEECAKWLMERYNEEKSSIMSYVVARLTFSEQLDDDPNGEFPEGEEPDDGDRSKVIEVLGFTRSVIANTIIEYDFLKNHPRQLTAYYKRTRIPGAAKFSSQIKKLYASVTK